MFGTYSRMLDRFPLLTKAATSGLLFSLGDIVTQKVIEKRARFDYWRNLSLFVTGSCYIAPMLHVWYCKILPRFVEPILPKGQTAKVLGKMAFDQLLFAPIVLSGFFLFHSTVSDGDPMKGLSALKQKFGQTMIANWKIWPIATTINFWLMPLKFQVLFSNMVGFFWNIILSYITYK